MVQETCTKTTQPLSLQALLCDKTEHSKILSLLAFPKKKKWGGDNTDFTFGLNNTFNDIGHKTLKKKKKSLFL